MIVTTLPKDLSAGASLLYKIALEHGGTIQRADDWTRKYYTRTGHVIPDPAFAPELVAAGLARTDTHTNLEGEEVLYLWVTAVDKNYSHLTDGSQDQDYGMYAEVSLLRHNGSEEVLLLTMFGATTRNDAGHGRYPIPTTRLIVRHSEATDIEHDSAYVADVHIVNPVLHDISWTGEVTLIGTLGEVKYCPDSTGPAPDGDYEPCDGGKYCGRGRAHPITEYMPKGTPEQAALTGLPVKVTLIPRRMVDERGQFIRLSADEN